ncbi:hypothetical protein [Dyadobacter sp. CY356]|uniref:hypothetical protein n=1 Tax=Dyadobacter sp. CY356 TaxID=2906442 RepID=UPI001F24821F|nr:hypothetical protein [Dyadobacter sp. CY356]MCF0059316.1 hypothetical protein [Dyadobacter sp. CY356]
MEGAVKNNKTKQITIEQAAGDGGMMVFSSVRSEKDVKSMSDWVEKRKAAISAQSLSSTTTK